MGEKNQQRLYGRPAIRLLYIGFTAACTAIMIAVMSVVTTHAAVSSSKRAVNPTTNAPITETAPGDTIKWVVGYQHTGQLGTMRLDDALPTNTQFVQGSLQTPDGYTKEYSTNGTNYTTTDPGTGATNIRVHGDAQPTTTSATGTSVTTGLIKPPESFDGASATGDGYEAFFWDGKIYNFNHHNDTKGYIQCHTVGGDICDTTGQGFTFPAHAIPTDGTKFRSLTDPAPLTDYYYMTNMNRGGIDQANGRVYLAASRVQGTDPGAIRESGVACFDIKNNQSCGFIAIQRGGQPLPDRYHSGGHYINGKFYLADDEYNVHCVNATVPMTLCGGSYPVKVDSTLSTKVRRDIGGGADLNLMSFDNQRIYTIFHPYDDAATAGVDESLTRSIGCLVVATSTPCTGFPVHYTLATTAGTHNLVLAPITDASGTQTGICGSHIKADLSQALFECFDNNGASVPTPWDPTDAGNTLATNVDVGAFIGQGDTLLIDTRLYFPLKFADGKARYVCWDYANTSAGTGGGPNGGKCEGFTEETSAVSVAPYTLREDPYNPGCIWEVGDSGQFEVFDATLGGRNCQRTSGLAQAEPASFYCDGQAGHAVSWADLRISNLETGATKPPRQYESAFLTIRGADGQPIAGFNNHELTVGEMTSGVVDLSAIPITGNSATLAATLSFIDVDGSAWSGPVGDPNNPYIQLTWNGDEIQFCFETLVQPCTQTAGITNRARFTTNDPSESISEAEASLPWSPASGCGPTPSFVVNKSASPTSGLQVGSTIQYTIRTTNTGNVNLTNVTTTDTKLAALMCQPGQPATLTTTAPGNELVCSGNYIVQQSDVDAGSITNTATTCAESTVSTNECRSDDLTIQLDRTPRLVPTKTLTGYDDTDGSNSLSAGDTANYQIRLKNEGNTTIVDATATDDRIATLSCQPSQTATLLPGQEIVCTGSLTVTSTDATAGKVTNTVTCTGTPPSGTTLPTCQTIHEEEVDNTSPSIQIIKSQPVHKTDTPPTGMTPGDTLTYSFTITNNGTQSLSNVSMTDTKIANVACNPAQPATLAINAQMTCSGDYTITQADQDVGNITNTATVTGTGAGGPVTDDDTRVTPLVARAPSLSVLKTASPASGVPVNGTIMYSILVTNNGNVTLTNVNVDDTLLATLGCTPAEGGALAPGDSMTCTGNYTVTQADIDRGNVHNTVTATGTAPDGTSVNGTDDLDVPLTRTAHLTNTKTYLDYTDNGDGHGPSTGDVLRYRLESKNDGTVTITDVVVDDAPTLDNFVCTPSQGARLEPGQSVVCTGNHIVTQEQQNAGVAIDRMQANGTPPPGVDPLNPNSPEVRVNLETPRKELAVTKTVESNDDRDNSSSYTQDDVVTYKVVARNAGNVSLSNVAVSDPSLTGLTCTPSGNPTLQPGQSVTCTGTYTITQADVTNGTHPNTATATGTAPDQSTVTGTSTVTIQIAAQTPAISLAKTITQHENKDNNPGVTPSDILHYELTAQNTGNVRLDGVVIADPQITSLACTPPAGSSMNPGQSMKCTGTITVTQAHQDKGEVRNTATVTGKGPGGAVVTDDAEAVQATVGRAPNAVITKTIDNQTPSTRFKVGDKANYTITYQNTGNVTLRSTHITDNRLQVMTCDRTAPVDLAPDETITCHGTGTAFTQDDQNRGHVPNTATGTSTTEQGELVRSADAVALLEDKKLDLFTDKAITRLHDTNGNQKGDSGERINYSITTTNRGNVTSLGVHVTDTIIGNLTCDRDRPTALHPGESITCTGEYVITDADAKSGRVHNIATATGQSTDGTKVESFDSETQLTQLPSLARTGDTIEWIVWAITGLGTVGAIHLVRTKFS